MEVKMPDLCSSIFKLKTPLSEEDSMSLNVGDIVYLSGILYTMRDMAHVRALELLRRRDKLPFDLRGEVIYHCGPLLKVGEVISAGPTTSMRIEGMEAELIELTGLRGIVGKGGMGERTAGALRRFGAVYMEFPGGAGALAAKAIKRVRDVYWRDLGDPEAVWVLEVEDFGPCIVTMDSKGGNFRTMRGAKTSK
ncbi:MAG: FumA C-terminus/TtdB family hydratase beta subunit [Candidatus Methanomethyliaceae archaeon]|nr:FumA C-terminus/TtdB family hydratase beta subunit [Candidatus Methanomethyliaceae archaeon]